MTILLGLLSATQPGDSLTRFPAVEGKNLEGRSFQLPRDFEGEFNVVVVAFRREQQADVDTWMPALKQLKVDQPGVHVYELPTMAKGYRIMRSFIDGGMRNGIPDVNVRAATITLYIDKAPFKSALGISTEDEIQLFLVDRDGSVHWRASGRFSETTALALWKRLQQYRESIAASTHVSN